MTFAPFDASDFRSMQGSSRTIQRALQSKINALRVDLGAYPEYELDFFRYRIARRPRMRGAQGLVFGKPRFEDGHWYFFDVGGDQNQVQLNIGMFPDRIRIGLGFMIGRQVAPKPPALQVFQSLIGARPPLPLRNALLRTIDRHSLRLEIQGQLHQATSADQIMASLETLHVPPNESTFFVFLGQIWEPGRASSGTAAEVRHALATVMPFYEDLNLASGAYYFHT